MAANEKHHFVPQFYLRNFSVNDDKSTIQLYNHLNNQFVPKATIKGQAREKFFYGKDDAVEKDLGKLESAVGLLFYNPITKIIPPTEAESFNLLREFILIQLFRTKKAASNLIDNLNSAVKEIASSLNIHLPSDARLTTENPVLYSLYNALQHLPLMNHLAIKSLVNLTDFPFITSDAPVVLYNQWMEKRGAYIGATALGVKGLQIFLPIHPRLIYCLYDPFIYECGTPENLVVKVETDSDIHQLNAMQYLFSDSHLYSDNNISQDYFEYVVQQGATFRAQCRSLNQMQKANESQSTNDNLLFFHSFVDPHFGLELSFFKIKDEAVNLPFSELPILRHPSFEKLKGN